jgi:NAD(P)-dependent dehydrogenase (short-subunit alcohol dehydrogenase family)
MTMALRGLEGKVAIVTGAADGIGAATARRLSEEGARLALVDVRAEPLQRLASGLGEGTLAMQADVSSAEDVERYTAAALEHFGRIDVAMLNAGVACEVSPIAESNVADFDRVIATNLRGSYLTMRAAIRPILAHGDGGAIVCTASMLALQGGPMFAPYVATKHAVLGLVRSAALELGRSSIRVNALCPGYVDTAMTRAVEELQGDAAAARAVMERFNAFGRYGEPEEIAAMAAWLLSDEASYCSGGAFSVDAAITAGAALVD